MDVGDIRDAIQKIKLGVSHNFEVNDGWLPKSLNRRINELEHSLQTLKIHTNPRKKRALINEGGRLINWLFGNMDDEDRLRIENHLQDIDLNQKNIIDNLNKRVKINNEMQGYLQNIRLVVERNRKWFNRVYTGMLDR
ncbi:hypothetical protein CVS40_10691 [Lucilia cuprina]|nr:hypothetical protein CVS40_10691 [Lucilia cuprina]